MRCGTGIAIVANRDRQWASATFAGMRHQLRIAGEDDAPLRRWLAALPEAELSVRGHLIADLAVAERDCAEGRLTAVIEVLSVEDR